MLSASASAFTRQVANARTCRYHRHLVSQHIKSSTDTVTSAPGEAGNRLPDHVQQLADLKRALDHAAIVATTDVTGRITYVNDKFVEISGYSREELIGRDHRIINSNYHPKEYIRDQWRTIAGGRVWHGELRNRAKNGHFYWVDTTIVPFLDSRGKPYQYIAIRSDITARKQAEEQLAQQAALARVGQMAAVVAHEVRNPLAGIKGAVQILMSRRSPDGGELPVMRDIVARIDALSELINDLMVFARPRRRGFQRSNFTRSWRMRSPSSGVTRRRTASRLPSKAMTSPSRQMASWCERCFSTCC